LPFFGSLITTFVFAAFVNRAGTALKHCDLSLQAGNLVIVAFMVSKETF
jgi:hypothetical protein